MWAERVGVTFPESHFGGVFIITRKYLINWGSPEKMILSYNNVQAHPNEFLRKPNSFLKTFDFSSRGPYYALISPSEGKSIVPLGHPGMDYFVLVFRI